MNSKTHQHISSTSLLTFHSNAVTASWFDTNLPMALLIAEGMHDFISTTSYTLYTLCLLFWEPARSGKWPVFLRTLGIVSNGPAMPRCTTCSWWSVRRWRVDLSPQAPVTDWVLCRWPSLELGPQGCAVLAISVGSRRDFRSRCMRKQQLSGELGRIRRTRRETSMAFLYIPACTRI